MNYSHTFVTLCCAVTEEIQEKKYFNTARITDREAWGNYKQRQGKYCYLGHTDCTMETKYRHQ